MTTRPLSYPHVARALPTRLNIHWVGAISIHPQNKRLIAMGVKSPRSGRRAGEEIIYVIEVVQHFVHDRSGTAVYFGKSWQVRLSPEWRAKEDSGVHSDYGERIATCVGPALEENSPSSVQFVCNGA